MAEILPEIRAKLDKYDWNDAYPRLVKFALSRIRGRYWYGNKGNDNAAGQQAEDFVSAALVKTYDGTRVWNPQTCSNLLDFLFGVIRSDINHAAESLCNKKTTELEAEGNILDQPQQSFSSPRDELEVQEQDEYLFGFIGFLKDEPVLIKMVEYIMDGILTPKEMALKLGIDVYEVYNHKKRLGRRLKEYRKTKDGELAGAGGRQ